MKADEIRKIGSAIKDEGLSMDIRIQREMCAQLAELNENLIKLLTTVAGRSAFETIFGR